MQFERAVVTGVAGFIGSTLAARLLDIGVAVRGLDCLTPYYDPAIKRSNLTRLVGRPGFEYHEVDLNDDDLDERLKGAHVVFNQAAQPGVRSSWKDGFASSLRNNVFATQRLLEAAKRSEVRRFVHASSSSVYGQTARSPMDEEGPTRPHSPYGVTKLSAEQLCSVYAENWGLPTISLRYFTVYGPRQRPDMAIHRLFQSALTGSPFPLYASADHVRDFTYVDDIVSANVAAAGADVAPGTVLNVAGGATVAMSELIADVESVVGSPVPIDDLPAQAGDVTRTEGDLTRARQLLGWAPMVSLRDGLAAQADWHSEASRLLVAS